MKIVIKEWLRNKKAVVMLLSWFVLGIIGYAISARSVALISITITDLENVDSNLIRILVIYLINILCGIGRSYFKTASMVSTFNTENNTFAQSILDADYDLFTKLSCAHITTVTEFCSHIGMAIKLIMLIVMDISNIAIILYSMYLIGGNIIIPVIVIYLIGMIILKVLFKKYEILESVFRKYVKERNQEMENSIYGFAEVRSYNTQDKHKKYIFDHNEKMYDNRISKAKHTILTNGSVDIIDLIALMLIIIYAVKLIQAGVLTQAAAMSLVIYVNKVIDPLKDIVEMSDELSGYLGLAQDFDNIVNYPNKMIEGPLELDEFSGEITFENVSFAYENTSNVLSNVNLSIRKGEKVGICGVSGGGKSTMFKLLNRFYVPDQGRITIDGININDISESSYRKFFGSVHQENTIFPGTIMENIVYGNPGASENEIILACKKANIYDFITGLDESFNTIVGPRGLTLSGGQKQRIAIARMFLRNPKIVLLDEATSALDNESERLIKDAIDSLDSETTVITIAHRLTTIRNCDKIFVVGNHNILECGSHEELMDLHGEYYKMATSKGNNRE